METGPVGFCLVARASGPRDEGASSAPGTVIAPFLRFRARRAYGQSYDAAIIAAAQRVAQYESAASGSTLAFATLMGHSDISELLELTRKEETQADALLSTIAEADVNGAAPGMKTS